jgi:hypothetical protein
MKNQLETPPQIIKINSDLTSGLDLRDPIHSKAYLLAAGHFLSSWNQEWDAETLALALLAEEDVEEDDQAFANQKEILVWSFLSGWLREFRCYQGHMYLESLINNLAEDFVRFASEVSG